MVWSSGHLDHDVVAVGSADHHPVRRVQPRRGAEAVGPGRGPDLGETRGRGGLYLEWVGTKRVRDLRKTQASGGYVRDMDDGYSGKWILVEYVLKIREFHW